MRAEGNRFTPSSCSASCRASTSCDVAACTDRVKTWLAWTSPTMTGTASHAPATARADARRLSKLSGLAERREAPFSHTVRCRAARMEPHQHAPWRSAFGDFCLRAALPGHRLAGILFKRAPRTGAVVPPGRRPEASRVWIATPPAGADPQPSRQTASGWPPRAGEDGREYRVVRGGGDKLGWLSPPWLATTPLPFALVEEATRVPNEGRTLSTKPSRGWIKAAPFDA